MPFKDLDKAREHGRERYRRRTRRAPRQRDVPEVWKRSLPPERQPVPLPAVRRSVRPSGPGTPGPRPKAGSTAAGIRRAAEGTGGREAGSASGHIRDAGLCTRCGRHAPVQGGATCQACRDARQAAERKLYAARRAEGQCGRCGDSALEGASRCGPCARLETRRHPRKNAASRRRYAKRRESWRCTDCGEPSQGAARCVPCAHRSWVRSGQHRGLPILPPRYTVIESATGEDHGTWDSWEEVAMCLAFARLSHDQVEIIISDTSPMASFTGGDPYAPSRT